MAALIDGYILVMPDGTVVRDSFRASKGAARGFLTNQPLNGKFVTWKRWVSEGWKCRFAVLDIYDTERPK